MRKSLYPRLAAQSLKLNRRFFVPYILSLVGNVAAFYIMSALVNDPGVADMTPGRANGYYYVQMMMSMGMFVAFAFSIIFVFYINGFLMKQRKRELGLYNILGMGKNHIAALMLLEGLYVGVVGIAGGLAVGMLLHKLVTLLLYRALDFGVPLGFYISWKGLTETTILFAALIGATVLVNLVKIQVSRPIELLRGGSVGEREPRTRWLLTILGVLTLGGRVRHRRPDPQRRGGRRSLLPGGVFGHHRHLLPLHRRQYLRPQGPAPEQKALLPHRPLH